MADGCDDGGTHLTEDIVIKILLYLPIASCIARFRCVCRSWRTLLSDPDFIRKILFHQNSDDQKSLQILVSGVRDRSIDDFPPLLFSVYSYETLRPITEPVTLMELRGCYSRVVGCCGGIFLIAQTWRNIGEGDFHNMLLWNPATSETKIIPPGPFHPARLSYESALELCAERIGFGYDPRTRDYKVVRVLEFEEAITDIDDDADYDIDYDPAEFYHGPIPLIFTEVYSLRNDSWKTLNVTNHYLSHNPDHDTKYLHHHWNTSRNEKCYWFRKENHGVFAIVSFDMSTEIFERVIFPQPVGFPHHKDDEDIYNDPYGDKSMINHNDTWWVKSCFMLKKGVIIATFKCRCWLSNCNKSTVPEDEIWVLMKYGVGESWTKLVAFPQPSDICHMEVWKDGAHICGCSAYICGCGDLSVYDIATNEPIRKHIEIEGTVDCFEVRVFTPTQVSMSRLVNSE
ncbi:F-box protein CPR1 [Linum perenne]